MSIYLDTLVNDKITKREQEICRDVERRKKDMREANTKNAEEIAEVKLRIKETYPDGITEPHLLKHYTKIQSRRCKTCDILKICPYEYLSLDNKKVNGENCSICTKVIYKEVRRCQEEKTLICECGMKYYGSEDNHYRHQASSSHIKRMKTVIGGHYYTQAELYELAKKYKIKYYLKKTKEELVECLREYLISSV